MAMQLILGSTSRYRRELLARLRIPFECMAPDVDETPLSGDSPAQRAQRLALAKAEAVAAVAGADAVVIGSDQVASLQGRLLRKPHQHEQAVLQLQQASGRQVDFHTAVSILGPGECRWTGMDHTVVVFAELSEAQIQRYLHAEQPYDCAGSFKCEGLGISLFEAIHSSDPTALIGLPLIAVSKVLRGLGFDCP